MSNNQEGGRMTETAEQRPAISETPAPARPPQPPHPEPRSKRLHPLGLRIMHWTNAVAILIMIASGIKIYGDSPIFSWLSFPNALTLGGDPDIAFRMHGNFGQSGALQWHFLGMWIVVINGLAYLIYGIVTGRLRRMLLPIRPREVIATIRDAMRFHLSHDDLTVYNGVQKLLYVGIILIAIVEVLAGLAIWKPVQLSHLAALFYSFQGARLVHFFGMAAIVAFLVVHVLLALLVPQTLLAMITGGPRVARTPAAVKLAPQPGE
jgi:thiosulfate reductase cytochrome b subunit